MTRATIRVLSVYGAVLLGAGALYAVGCAPGALWQDSGLIQVRVWRGDVEGFLGLAISHPLFYLVAIATKAIPFGVFAHKVNLVSALAGAVAAANLYLLVRLWTGREFPALIAAATLALSHTFWQHASIAETYTLWSALFVGELIVLLRYSQTRRAGYLYALGLLNGLAIAVHMLAVIPLACYVVVLAVLLARKTLRVRDGGLVAVCWMLGALAYEYLIVRQMLDSGDVLGTLASAAFGDRWQGDVLNMAVSWDIVKENLLLIALNFPTPNFLLFVAGCIALWKMRADSIFRGVVAVLLVLFFLFAFRFTVSDRYAFFIPFYILVSTLVGLGVHLLLQRMSRRAIAILVAIFALLPPAVYAVAPTMAQRMDLDMGTRGDIAYRDDYTYFLQPWKLGDDGASRFAHDALEVVGPDAIIYADTTTVAPLLLAQEVEGLRPDVKIVTGIIRSEGAPAYGAEVLRELVRRRPIYVTSQQSGYAPAFLLDEYDLRQAGPLWQVVRPEAESR